MNSHKRLLIFFIISFGFHILVLYFSKPQLLLFSPIQNIKLKKKELTKVKLLKIQQKVKPKPKTKSKNKIKLKPKIKKVIRKHKTKVKSNKRKTKHKKIKKVKRKSFHNKTKKTKFKSKLKTKNKKSKLKTKSRTKSKTSKKHKVDLSSIHKRVAALKKKEEEEKLKKELKKEAAYFYANRLVSLVQRLWIFPKSIPDNELPFLKIKVKLRVRKDGTIIGEPVIISKSDNKIFNESALRAVKKLYKFKIPLPDIIDDKYIDIILTLTPPEK